jgi:uncharacterized protein YjbI with pentapeptide repeats
MKAEEVRKRYAAGDRDFSGADLRGHNFKGQDLTGANFSYADIQGANFTGAKAGVQKRSILIQLLLVLALSVLAGFLQGYSGYFVAFYFPRFWDLGYDSEYLIRDLAVTAAYFITIITTFVAIIRQGFTFKAFITIAVTVTIALAFAFAFAFAGAVALAVAFAGAVALAVAGAFAGAVAFAFAFAFAGAVALAVAGAFAGAFAFAFAGAVAVAVAFAGAFAGAVAVLLLSLYVAWRVRKEDEKFALARTIGIAFGAIGGTSFYKADLTDATFSSAILKSTNFNEATLTRTCWTNAKQLDRARPGNSIFSNIKVRELLVTGNGYSKPYADCNLRGANLTGATLHKANLKRADLGEATLHKADLRDANLTEVQAIDTDFTAAALTGACLEGWNIDHTTKLDRVDCQYVFLLEHPNAMGNRERRPHDPDRVFEQGDFEKLYKKMINVVQILLRDGINQEAFRAAFLKLMEEHPEISFDSIQAIEKKGNDVLVTLEVAETADKAQIAQSFLKPYEDRVRQLEAEKERLQLQADHLTTRISDIATTLASKPHTIINQAVGDGKAVNENINPSQNFSVGGDFNLTASNSVVSLRDISGTVTNAIAQLPAASTDEPNLKALLTQLQAVLETADPALLPDADKADALEQVKLLAEAAQKPEPEKKTSGAKAMRFLQRIVDAVPKAVPMATTLVTEFNKLVPAIVTLLGL